MENYSSIIPILRELKKLHLDTTSRRKVMTHPEKVANMVTKILSLRGPVKDKYFSAFWLWNGRVQSFNQKIGEVDFYETYDLFNSLESFFKFQYGIDIGVYEIDTQGNGELITGNKNSFKRDLHLGKTLESWKMDYVLERKCLRSQRFESSNHINGNGGKGAIYIGNSWSKKTLLSIGSMSSPFNEILMIQQGFEQGGFGQIIRSKIDNIHKLYKDALTGLYNREYFNQITKQHLYSFMCIDLNNFKQINDTFGHLAWDQVLRITARIFESSIRKNDKACRLWWDEFFLLIDTYEKPILENISRVIKSKFHEHEVIRSYNEKLGNTLGLAIGGHVFEPGITTEEHMNKADIHMYADKIGNWVS